MTGIAKEYANLAILDSARRAAVLALIALAEKFSGNYDTFNQAPWANGLPDPLTVLPQNSGQKLFLAAEMLRRSSGC